MAVIKCKMCGGDLVLIEGQSVAECEYCGSRQTVPAADNEKKLNLFARANRLRLACEFDKAAGIYEAIVADFPEEAETYWGLVLCKYGIEYVDDPATGKKIPTCHRSSFDSVMDDSNFEQAMENADELALRVYRQEAKQIETIRKGILEVSSSEKPYDIFICYKETDSNGDRTVDSLLAQDIYDALVSKGYRVFFSRITLEDKLGQAYEPYIFAALNSAKIMLAVGTCYEHYNAVWVKNEWSRYLKIVAQDKSKYLIPCYKGLDAYDMPKEFAHLQGQDMGKVGAMADLLRGIEKLLHSDPKIVIQAGSNVTTASLLKRAYLFLEDQAWDSANEYCEKVLDIDPENGQAYLGKLLAEFRISKEEALGRCTRDFTAGSNYHKALRFGDERVRTLLDNARKDQIYHGAKKLLGQDAKKAAYQDAAARLSTISGWRDSDELLEHCQSRMREIQTHTASRQRKNPKENGRKKHKTALFLVAIVALTVAGLFLFPKDPARPEAEVAAEVSVEYEQYMEAISLMNAGRYEEALESFESLGGYKDSIAQIENCRIAMENAILEEQYAEAEQLAAEGKHAEAGIAFAKLEDYQDSRDRSFEQWSYARPRTTLSEGFSYPNRKYQIGLKKDGTVYAAGNNAFGTLDAQYWTDIVEVMALPYTALGLKSDGTVCTAGDYKIMPRTLQNEASKAVWQETMGEIRRWTDIVSIRGDYSRVVGLKKDGTIVVRFLYDNEYNDVETSVVEKWTDIVDVYLFSSGIIGLQADGSVVGVNVPEEITDWKNVVSLGYYSDYHFGTGKHIMGRCADGSVYVLWDDNSNNEGTNDWTWEYHGKIDGWTDIVDVCGPLGLHADGTVSVYPENAVYSGINKTYLWKDAVKDWNQIAVLFGNSNPIYGLKSDGTVVSAGMDHNGETNVSDWTDIVSLKDIGSVTCGIRKDGSVVVAEYVDLEMEKWTDIQTP